MELHHPTCRKSTTGGYVGGTALARAGLRMGSVVSGGDAAAALETTTEGCARSAVTRCVARNRRSV
jgi:hypothetical protein